MKTKKLLITAFMIISGSAILTFNGCKGKDGAPGAQGPAGTNGNANVTSGTVTVSNWTYDGTNKLYKATIIDNNITQAIVDEGVVLVYLISGGGNLALPVTIYPTSTYSETISFVYGLQQVVLSIQDSDLTQPGTPGSINFRVVKIAPSGIIAHPDVDFKNYTQVKAAFNLND